MSFNIIYVIVILFGVTAACPNIISRRAWGALPPKKVAYQIIPVEYVIFHHTVGNMCANEEDCMEQVRNIQGSHMNDNDWDDIGYNFLIGNDGNVYEGVGWRKIGAHTLGYNSKSMGIAFMGNFSRQLPSSAAMQAAKELMQCGANSGELSNHFRLLAAMQVTRTASPGLKLYQEIQDWSNWAASP